MIAPSDKDNLTADKSERSEGVGECQAREGGKRRAWHPLFCRVEAAKPNARAGSPFPSPLLDSSRWDRAFPGKETTFFVDCLEPDIGSHVYPLAQGLMG